MGGMYKTHGVTSFHLGWYRSDLATNSPSKVGRWVFFSNPEETLFSPLLLIAFPLLVKNTNVSKLLGWYSPNHGPIGISSLKSHWHILASMELWKALNMGWACCARIVFGATYAVALFEKSLESQQGWKAVLGSSNLFLVTVMLSS